MAARQPPSLALLGAGPSAAAHPNARRCALGTPGPPRVPLARRLGRGPRRFAGGRAAAIASAPAAPGNLAALPRRPPAFPAGKAVWDRPGGAPGAGASRRQMDK